MGRLHIRSIQRSQREFWCTVTEMWEASIPVLPRLLPHYESTPTLYIDASPTGWSTFLEGRTLSSVWEEHVNLLEMGTVLLSMRLFPRSDSRAVSVDSHMQYNSGRIKGTNPFSVDHLCREIIFLCDSFHTVLSVRHVPVNQNLIADTLSRFRVPVNTEWELYSMIFQAIDLDRFLIHVSACHKFELQTGDLYFSNFRPESLGGGCNAHFFEREVQLHLSTVSSSPQHFVQDKRG